MSPRLQKCKGQLKAKTPHFSKSGPPLPIPASILALPCFLFQDRHTVFQLLLLTLLPPPVLQPLFDLLLKAQFGRVIVSSSSEVLGKIFFLNEMLWIIVGVLIFFSVTQILHQC